MLRSRYVVGAAIVVFWLVMTSLLVDREVLVPRAEERASGLGEYDTWMSIYLPEDDGTEKKVGFVHSQAKSTWRDGIPGFSYSLLFKMRAQLMGEPSELRVDGSAWIPKDSGLSTFEFEVSSSDVHGMTIAGSIGEGAINLDVGTGDQSIPVELPIQDQVQLFGAMGSTTLNVPDLEVGEEVLIESFDPMSLSMGRARIECIGETDFTFDGETIPVKRLETTLSGLTSETWVTAKEEVVYVRTPLGMIFRKETPLLALEMDDSATGEGLISQVAVRPTGKQPFRGARKMTFRVGGVPEDVQPPSDAIQRQTSDQTYTISAPASYLDAPPIALDNPEPHLLGDALVQVGNEKIQAQADAILDGIDPGWDTAMALYDWVYGNIEKKVVLSFPSAIEVLETRQGDCNEHTVLYAALARSAGLPTQIAIGVVWSEQLGGFYYHAWPEVYVDRWIPMDPTLGQPIADATHIKLLNGNIESWPRLVPYLGQLKLEILEIE